MKHLILAREMSGRLCEWFRIFPVDGAAEYVHGPPLQGFSYLSAPCSMARFFNPEFYGAVLVSNNTLTLEEMCRRQISGGSGTEMFLGRDI
jgi:hypothetical protein